MKLQLAVLGLAVLGSVASAQGSAQGCSFGPGAAVLEFVNSSGQGTKRVLICQRPNHSLYAQYTAPGFPGDITTAEDVVFQNRLATANGPLRQFVTLQKTSLLDSNSVTVLAYYEQSNKLEIVKEIGSPSNTTLIRR